jgi:WD40 repeat protein
MCLGVQTVTTPTARIRWQAQLVDHVGALAFSHDGALLAAGSLGGDAAIWGASDGENCQQLTAHPMGVLCLDWAPKDHRIGIGGQDGIVRVWAHDGSIVEELGSHDEKHWVESVAWSPDGESLALASGRNVVVIGHDGAHKHTLGPHSATVTEVAWSPDGSRTGAASYGGVTWWPVGEPDPKPRSMNWKGALLSLRMSPDGKWVAGGCQDASVHLWRLWSGDDLQMSGYPSKVEHLSWHPSSRYLAVANPSEITIWDFSGKGPAGTAPRVVEAHQGRVNDLAFDPSGRWLASVGDDGGVCISVGSNPRRATQIWQLPDPLSRLAWDPTGQHLAVASTAGSVAVLSLVD